jgi:hypothetical protein
MANPMKWWAFRLRRDLLGSLIGLLVFLGGIALLLFTFKLAYEMFTVPPSSALGLQPGKAVDLGVAGSNLATAALRVGLLIVMALVGSIIASRGIHLYTDSRGHIHEPPAEEQSEEVSRFIAEGGR